MSEILIFLDGLNKYSSLILMIATLVYVYFTYRLTKETTKLREVETTPFMSVYIKPDHMLELIIENIGKAAAYNVEFEMDEKYKSCFHCGCDFKHKISYFSPNQQLVIGMDSYQNLEKLKFENIPIKVKYYSKEKELFEDTFSVEWKYLSGSALSTDNLEGIKKEIEKTVKEVKNLNQTIKDKEYFVTNKLKILEFEKTDTYVGFVFSNGYLIKVPLKEFTEKTGMEDIEEVYIDNGDLQDYSTGLKYTSEEIYDKLKDNKSKGDKQ